VSLKKLQLEYIIRTYTDVLSLIHSTILWF